MKKYQKKLIKAYFNKFWEEVSILKKVIKVGVMLIVGFGIDILAEKGKGAVENFMKGI